MPEPLRAYLVARGASAGDSLLVRIIDGEQGICEIEHEPMRMRDMAAVFTGNRELADVAAELLAGRGTARTAPVQRIRR